MSDKQAFAERLRDLRKSLGISQVELAARLNVTSSSVSFWETMRSLPTFEQLMTLTQILGVSSDTLLGLDTHQQVEKTCGIWWNISRPPAGSPYATPDLEDGIELFLHIVQEGLTTAEIQAKYKRFRDRSTSDLRLLLKIALLSHSIRLVNVERSATLEAQLSEKWNLKGCLVADLQNLPSDPVIDGMIRTEALAFISARDAPQYLENMSSVGLIGGRTLSRFVDFLQPASPRLKHLNWVSLMATAGTIAPFGMTANGVVERMAYMQQSGDSGICYRLPYVDALRRSTDYFRQASGQERDELENARAALYRAQNVDAAFMSVGALMNRTPEAVPMFKVLQQLSAKDHDRVKGDILLRLVDENGQRVGSQQDQDDNDAQVYSISLLDLQAIAARGIVWVVAGELQKSPVVGGAIKSLYANGLVTEPIIAAALLQEGR